MWGVDAGGSKPRGFRALLSAFDVMHQGFVDAFVQNLQSQFKSQVRIFVIISVPLNVAHDSKINYFNRLSLNENHPDHCNACMPVLTKSGIF